MSTKAISRFFLRFSWLVSAAALAVFYTRPVEVYFSGFGVLVSRAVFQDIVLCLFGGMLLLQAVRRPQQDAMHRAALNALPVLVLLSVVGVSVTWLGTVGLGLLFAVHLDDVRLIGKAARRGLRRSMTRSVVRSACVCFALTGLLGGIRYAELTSRQGRQDAPLLVHAEPAQKEACGALREAARILSPEWTSLGEADRLSLLRAVMQAEAKRLGAGELTLKAEKISADYGTTLARFLPWEMTIEMNADVLMEGDGEQALSSLLHECRHAYQYRVIGMIDWSSRDAQEHPFYGEARAWRVCFSGENGYGNTVRTEREFDTQYYDSEIEIDARAYARRRAEEYIAAVRGR